MKEILLQYATYNLWANKQILAIATALDPAMHDKEIKSSFLTIRLTAEHLRDVEYIWWQRMKLVETVLPLAQKKQTLVETMDILLAYSRQWKEWVEKSTNAAFEHEFVYRNSKHEQFKQPVYQVLLHLFNHQSYHRGQLVTMLRQTGQNKLPSTDFITWTRIKNKKIL